jgi:hypothetical protein
MSGFYGFPEAHWAHLRTASTVETALAALKLCAESSKGSRRSPFAESILWKLLWVAERGSRRMSAPELLATLAGPSGPDHDATGGPRGARAA